jgi:hypothetical protein
MSVGYLNFTQEFGWLPIHTIMPHKRQVGWIPSDRILATPPGSSATGNITRSALGGATGYRLAQIPISDTSEYIVEARGIAGYDAKLPAEAVVIHEVIRGRAYVVDPDNNGNPNDESAIWRPGETFTDLAHKISISVISAAASGFNVSIQRGTPPVAIVSPSLRKSGVVSVPYADTLSATGGIGGFTWSLIDGTLPDGLTLNASSGVISGTPSRAGPFAFAVRAVSAGEIGEKAFNVSVLNQVVFVSDSTRRMGLAGTPYADTLVASGGSGTFSWSVASGTIPPGLSLSTATGIISGTPTSAGDFRFTVAAGSAGATASRALHVIVAAAIEVSPLIDQLLGAGSMTADQIRYLDLGGNRNGRLDVGDVRAWLISTNQLNASGTLNENSSAAMKRLDAMVPRDSDSARRPKRD